MGYCEAIGMLSYEPVSIGLVVSQCLMAAKHAAAAVSVIGFAEQYVTMAAFTAVLRALDVMHDRQIHLDDIQRDNLALGACKVPCLDVDERCHGLPAKAPGGTYNQPGTGQSRIQGRDQNRRLALLAAGQYAMLQSMLAACMGNTAMYCYYAYARC